MEEAQIRACTLNYTLWFLKLMGCKGQLFVVKDTLIVLTNVIRFVGVHPRTNNTLT